MAGLLKQDPYHWTLWLSEKLKTWKYCASILADDALRVKTGADMDNLHLRRRSYDFLCQQILYKTMPVCHRWTIAGGVHQNYYTQCILLEKEMTIKNIPRTVTGLSVYTKDYAIVFLTGALMIGNVSIRGTYKTVCLIPYTLHFLYMTE